MSARVMGLTVALENDIEADLAQQLVQAIGMMKGVIAVAQIESGPGDWINRQQIRMAW